MRNKGKEQIMKTERMTEVAEMRSNMAAAILKTLGSDYSARID